MGGFSELGLRAPRSACPPAVRYLAGWPATWRWASASRSLPSRRRTFAALLATASIMGAGNAFAQDPAKPAAPEPASSSEDLAKKFELMDQRIRALEAELKKKNDA